MKHLLTALIVVLAAPLYAATSPTVATVGDDTITLSQLEDRLKTYPPGYQEAFKKRENKVKVLNQMIDEHILYLHAREKGYQDKPEYADKLEQAKKQILATMLMSDKVAKKSKVSKKDIRNYYKNNPDKFEKLEQRYLRHILVPTKDEADRLHRSLQNGTDFQKLAQTKSVHPSGKAGGGIGWVQKGQIDAPAVDTAAFKLKRKGSYTKPLRSQYGYHIVQFVDSRTRPKITYELAKDQIQEMLTMQKKKDAAESYLDTLRVQHTIKRNITPIQ